MTDPWVVRDKPQAVPVPVGMYLVEFAGFEDKTLPDGPRWRWAWKVKAGDHAGQYATALTGCDIHPASAAGVLIAGLLGRPIRPGENVKAAVEGCVGKTYMVSVQPGPKGGKPAVRSVGTPPPM
jgi:hypothetical protein